MREREPITARLQSISLKSRLRFDFGENDVENRNKLHDLVQKLAFENFDGLFCFKNPANGNKNGHKWYSYDVKEEFKRMTSSLGADCQWKISSENEKFKICETYPPLLIGKVQKKSGSTL